MDSITQPDLQQDGPPGTTYMRRLHTSHGPRMPYISAIKGRSATLTVTVTGTGTGRLDDYLQLAVNLVEWFTDNK
jgi:hypothetical protein